MSFMTMERLSAFIYSFKCGNAFRLQR